MESYQARLTGPNHVIMRNLLRGIRTEEGFDGNDLYAAMPFI
jgi:hypothetical protein